MTRILVIVILLVRISTEWQMEVMATILVGCLLVVSAIIAIFILHRFRKMQEYAAEVN